MMSNPYEILLVEDDKNLGYLLSRQLKEKGFNPILSPNGRDGLQVFKDSFFDLCIIDVMLPGKDGLTLAKEIKALDENVPIVFLTARNLKSDKKLGFESGCDDYITKPFDTDELIYRVNAILKRTSKKEIPKNDIYKAGDLSLHSTLCQLITPDGKTINISFKETLLIKLLFSHVGEVVSRNYLMERGWGNNNLSTSNSLDVYLTKLRKLFKNDPKLRLQNIHAHGYRLVLINSN